LDSHGNSSIPVSESDISAQKQQSVNSTAPPAPSPRFLELDYVRGVIIFLMCFDHTYDAFIDFGSQPEYRQGEYYDKAAEYPDGTAYEFWSRIAANVVITGFHLLMGINMRYLAESRKKQGWEEWRIIKYFLIRGFILFLVDFWLPLGMIDYIKAKFILFQTLSALGVNMMLGGCLLFLQKQLNEKR